MPDPTADLTPDYTFNALVDFGNSITYGGACSSSTVFATPGNNTITFNFLPPGTYTNCTITVTDDAGTSNILAVPPFTILPCTPTGTLEDVCNGVDDNCDGDVDEDFVLIDCDGPDLGVCEEGYIECVGGALTACTDTTGDDIEYCDGYDNDCDTIVDNGGGALCDDSNTCTTDVCNGFSGCGASTAIPGTYLTCVGSSCVTAPNSPIACTNAVGCLTLGDACTCVPTSGYDGCNGVDDDCDGSVDEDYLAGGFCANGVGACQAFGGYQCIAGVESCDAVAGTPVPELCNGLDDDCDGINDNGAFGGGPADLACNDANGCTVDACNPFSGACQYFPDEYHYECQGTSCVQVYNPVCTPDSCDPLDFFSCGCVLTGIGEDICNGVDDDCDGSIDEGYVSVPCTDGVGACAANGTTICMSGAESCYGAFPGSPQPEVCGDSVDQDCNGSDLACPPTCISVLCGNGTLDVNEQCDDGNAIAGDSCSPNCFLETCGTGILDPGEQCDDSNTNSGDGCSSTCTVEAGSPSIILGTTDNGPTGITIDSAGNIYTANTGANTVTKITPAGVSTTLGTTGSGTRAIVVDATDNVYTADQYSNTVTKITPAGVSTTLGTTGNSPFAITIDPAGNIYTANLSDNTVTKITPAGVSTTLGTTGSGPFGITIDSVGNIYTADLFSNTVTKITPAGVSTTLGTTGSGPYAITIDSAGNIYTTNSNDNTVTKITPAGVSTTLGTTGSFPIGITIDPAGNVYTSNNSDNTVTKITPAGVSTTLGTTGNSPRGITIDPVGSIYIANQYSDTVTKINPAAVCGNGTTDIGETCDDSNFINGDGCSAACQTEACGNGILDLGETCDDGNVVSGDGCEATCALPLCTTCTPTGVGEVVCNRADDDCDGSIDEDYVSVACTVGVGLCQTTGVSQCYGLGEQCYAFAGTPQPEICGNGIDEDCNGSDLLCTCGNTVLDPGETCDDGNTISNDGCSATCQTETCGDGIINGAEECDGLALNDNLCVTIPGGFTGGTLSCSVTCTFDTSLCIGPVCGDGNTDPGETCDDGNLTAGDGCSATCTLESCGNGITEGTEQCDDANLVNNDACTNACLNATCGDSFLQAGETCDDSNLVSNDGCSATCQTETCGDGITQLTEQCDDANLINTDGCTNVCTTPICGDSILNGTDQCDDGNAVNTDGCTNTCLLPVCGDSFIQPGETCDDSNTNPNDGCSATCQNEVCGNGLVEGLEQCDDANLVNTDGCTNVCTTPICGDSIVNGTDQCDDGNLINTDSCTNTCRLATCGDTFLQAGELCDDGNVTPGDGCSATCTLESCGNGITEGTELCDDGNLINTDACTNACLLPVCGDSIVNGTDQCDDGNAVNTDGCTNACTLAICGDSFIQPGETCDDSNTTSNDGCSSTCQTESCGDGITQASEQCDDANLVNTDACTNACTLPVCGDGITNGTEACDDGNLSNIDTCTILCILTADPGITKTVDNPNPDLDGIISYFITVTNNGPSIATGVVVTDILPPGLTLLTANVTGGALTLPTWTLASMAPFTTETLTITASVDVTNPITNIATVTSTSPDIDPLNNQDQVTVNPQAATVQGHLFRDDNENQLQDPGESDLPNISVRITDRNSFLRIAVTNASGDYTSIIPPGTATLEIDASDPDFPDDYIITVDSLLRTINALPGINPVHFFGIDVPDTVTTKNTKDKKRRSITVTLQRTLVATGIPLEAGAALGYFSLLAITALSLKRTRRW